MHASVPMRRNQHEQQAPLDSGSVLSGTVWGEVLEAAMPRLELRHPRLGRKAHAPVAPSALPRKRVIEGRREQTGCMAHTAWRTLHQSHRKMLNCAGGRRAWAPRRRGSHWGWRYSAGRNAFISLSGGKYCAPSAYRQSTINGLPSFTAVRPTHVPMVD
jgi:hypothetical protein